MSECDRRVVGIVLFDENVPVEPAHLGDAEDADRTEGSRLDGEDFALCDVGAELRVGCRLDPVDRDLAGCDVALERAVGNFLRKRAGHDLLVLHLTERELARCSVAAVEAHECVGELVVVVELALDLGVVHVLRDGVVDVEERDGIVADDGADVLGKCAVDIDFTCYGNAPLCKAAVDEAGNESELRLECGPALACDCDILPRALVVSYPVEECQLILCELAQDLGLLVAAAEFLCHIVYD